MPVKTNRQMLEPFKIWTHRDPYHYIKEWWKSLPSFLEIIVESVQYFSMWNILFIGFHILHTTNRISCPILYYNSVLCSVGGWYMTWIFPRKLYVRYCRLYVRGWDMILMDIIGHHLVLIYILCKTDSVVNFYKCKCTFLHAVMMRIMPLVYLLCFNCQEKYNLYWRHLIHIFFICECLISIPFYFRINE